MGKLTFKQVAPTFAAEVEGVDFTKTVPPDVIQEVRDGITKYGVLVFRGANLDDDAHVEFASNFGELEPTPAAKLGNRVRLPSPYIGDLANVDFEGKLVTSENRMGALFAKGNEIWHKDMMYHPRRCHYSTLRSVILPPEGTGGETLYADSRAAYEALSPEMKDKIENMVANCSLLHNRRKAAPELYPGVDPYDWPIARYKLVYPHEGDGRKDLYVSTYMYQIDGLSIEETQELVDQLIKHATQENFVHTVHWHNAGDMVMWDNTAVMHRATDGSRYRGKYIRDVRRTSAWDEGKYAWGENDSNNPWIISLPKDPFHNPSAPASEAAHP